MWDWIVSHDIMLWRIAVASAVLFVLTLLLVPIMLVRMPSDYFTTPGSAILRLKRLHPALRWLLIGVKNCLGLICIAAGIAMLVLPGQGLLTIVVGLMLTDFPGKSRFEQWLIRKPAVWRSVNWIRMRAGRDPLRLEPSVSGSPP